jgi:hypothetical protein
MMNRTGLAETGGYAGGGFHAGYAAEARSVLGGFRQPVYPTARYGQELGIDFRVMRKSGFRLETGASICSLIIGERQDLH